MELVSAVHLAETVGSLVVERLRRVAPGEESLAEGPQPLRAQHFVSEERDPPHLNRGEELFDGLDPSLLGFAPGAEKAVAHSARENAINDDGVHRQAVEAKKCER